MYKTIILLPLLNSNYYLPPAYEQYLTNIGLDFLFFLLFISLAVFLFFIIKYFKKLNPVTSLMIVNIINTVIFIGFMLNFIFIFFYVISYIIIDPIYLLLSDNGNHHFNYNSLINNLGGGNSDIPISSPQIPSSPPLSYTFIGLNSEILGLSIRLDTYVLNLDLPILDRNVPLDIEASRYMKAFLGTLNSNYSFTSLGLQHTVVPNMNYSSNLLISLNSSLRGLTIIPLIHFSECIELFIGYISPSVLEIRDIISNHQLIAVGELGLTRNSFNHLLFPVPTNLLTLYPALAGVESYLLVNYSINIEQVLFEIQQFYLNIEELDSSIIDQLEENPVIMELFYRIYSDLNFHYLSSLDTQFLIGLDWFVGYLTHGDLNLYREDMEHILHVRDVNPHINTSFNRLFVNHINIDNALPALPTSLNNQGSSPMVYDRSFGPLISNSLNNSILDVVDSNSRTSTIIDHTSTGQDTDSES